MTTEELTVLAEKIKIGKATEEETIKFHEEFNKLIKEVEDLLEK